MWNRLSKKIFFVQKSYYSSFATHKKGNFAKMLAEEVSKKARPNPIVKKLDSQDFKNTVNEDVMTLTKLFEKYGFEIRIAGGAVRDLLAGIQPKDLDFATTATPSQMKDMFQKEEVRMINMNGEKHGTITPRINDNVNFEVTTLRIDVVTDGRHAKIEFTTNWMLDAFRRDLTINSMFLGLDGSVYDYFYGLEDLQKKRVVFVGDASTRIQEDYLRILRYFRFYGRIAEEPNKHEESTLSAIRNNVEGLKNISGERLWTELKKILEGNFAGDLMATIIENKIAPFLGLPENSDTKKLLELWTKSGHLNLNPITLISPLLLTLDDAVALNNRLKLSAFERDLALFLVEHREPKLHPKNALMPYKQLLIKSKSTVNVTKLWIIELLKLHNSPNLEEFSSWSLPKFPVSGAILKKQGVEGGRFMGLVLNELKNYWAETDFELDSEELLKQLPNVLQKLSVNKKK